MSQAVKEVLVAGVDEDPESPLDEIAVAVIFGEGLPGKRVEIIAKAHGTLPQFYG
jgi:hypothetical protein